MKQLMFMLTAMLIAVLPAKAQTTQVATLSHEGTISTFYSANALKDAYAVAVDGDIITLSSGTFIATDLKKNITIRGAGMILDNNPTIISGETRIVCPESETNYLTLEGIFFNGNVNLNNTKDTKITKCYFTNFYPQNSPNISAANCKFNGVYMSSGTTGNFINSYLGNLYGGDCPCSYTNCVISFNVVINSSSPWRLGGSNLTNCIIETLGNTNEYFNKDTTLTHCYHFGEATDPFKESLSKTNVMLEGSPFANDNYELTEEAKAICVGTDGTEAGMYGGFLPFDPTPTNPQITKFNVASKTTADGKLSVDIEVNANN